MTSATLQDAAVVEKTTARLAEIRPAYASILHFYGPVFAAQAKAAYDTSPAPIRMEEAAMQMRRKEGFALIEPTSFTIDSRSAEKLLESICSAAADSGEKLAEAANALDAAKGAGATMEGLFGDVVADKKERIQVLAQEKNVPPDMLLLLLYLAIRPSIEAGARQLSTHLEDGPNPRSSCPVCGRAPILGELDADGNQWTHCSLCWHRWTVKRMVCQVCGNRNSDSLEYLYSENEPEYRVYLCHACQHYCKVVDTRKLTRAFIPQLEQVVSMHLDMLAAEKGFTHAMGAAAAEP